MDDRILVQGKGLGLCFAAEGLQSRREGRPLVFLRNEGLHRVRLLAGQLWVAVRRALLKAHGLLHAGPEGVVEKVALSVSSTHLLEPREGPRSHCRLSSYR